jgi:hypothetical protein
MPTTTTFSFTADGRNVMLQEIKTLLLNTELGGNANTAYNISSAGTGKSGYSIGLNQFDLHADGNKTLAAQRLATLGFSSSEILSLMATPSAANPVSAWSDRLNTATNRALLDQYANQDLLGKVARLESLSKYRAPSLFVLCSFVLRLTASLSKCWKLLTDQFGNNPLLDFSRQEV